jgi:hypothetical protein
MMFPLYELVSEVEEFCSRMGFKPVPDDSLSPCYNGNPTANTKHLNKKSNWMNFFTWPSNKSFVDWSTWQILIYMMRSPAIYKRFF